MTKSILVIAALLLSACGGAETMPPEDGASAAVPAPAPVAPAATPSPVESLGTQCTFANPGACPYSAEGGTCWTQAGTRGSGALYCSIECGAGCPAGAGCQVFAGGFGLCFKLCDFQSDCPTGTTCFGGLCEPPLTR